MNSEAEQALLQPPEEEQEEKLGLRNGMHDNLNLKHQLKSLQILKSALKIFTSNTKVIFLLVLSILPLFIFMVFYEIKISEEMDSISNFLKPLSSKYTYVMSEDGENEERVYDDDSGYIIKLSQLLLKLLGPFLFYLFLYPLLEFFSMSLTLKIAAKVYAAEKPATLSLRDLLQQKINIKGPLITYLCVHLLSTMTLLGLLWIISNHFLILSSFDYYDSIDCRLIILSTTAHSVLSLGLLYKYLEWSAFWNMSVVVSVTEEQTGIKAFGVSDYYGKHCNKTGFQLMLGFFVFGNVLRLPCLLARFWIGSVATVLITYIAIMLVSMKILVKWVTFLLYYYYCKQQTMLKKSDHKLDESVYAADLP